MGAEAECDHLIGMHDWGYDMGVGEFRSSDIKWFGGSPDKPFRFCPDCGAKLEHEAV